jgi:hypothetical protein
MNMVFSMFAVRGHVKIRGGDDGIDPCRPAKLAHLYPWMLTMTWTLVSLTTVGCWSAVEPGGRQTAESLVICYSPAAASMQQSLLSHGLIVQPRRTSHLPAAGPWLQPCVELSLEAATTTTTTSAHLHPRASPSARQATTSNAHDNPPASETWLLHQSARARPRQRRQRRHIGPCSQASPATRAARVT